MSISVILLVVQSKVLLTTILFLQEILRTQMMEWTLNEYEPFQIYLDNSSQQSNHTVRTVCTMTETQNLVKRIIINTIKIQGPWHWCMPISCHSTKLLEYNQNFRHGRNRMRKTNAFFERQLNFKNARFSLWILEDRDIYWCWNHIDTTKKWTD